MAIVFPGTVGNHLKLEDGVVPDYKSNYTLMAWVYEIKPTVTGRAWIIYDSNNDYRDLLDCTYDGALTAGQITTEMNSSTVVLTTNLWGDWPCVQGPNRLNDISGNNRNLQIVGSLPFDESGPFESIVVKNRRMYRPFAAPATSAISVGGIG